MNSTVALLVNIPTLFLLYVIIYFTQSLSGKRQFYGVSLNGDYFTKDEFKKLDKQFKLLVTLGFVLFAIIALVSIYMFSAYNFVSLFPPLGFCLYQFIIYVYVHNKVKTLKSELALNISDLDIAKTKVILDTDFINEKNRIIQKFSILFTVPLFILLLIGVYVLTKYNSIPDIIPIHWGFSGAPDDFIEKTFISVLGQI
ncbi:MAG: DUF1648 domain-containing protein, partial [Paraclostridium sp.]